jgi:hypothetical protein
MLLCAYRTCSLPTQLPNNREFSVLRSKQPLSFVGMYKPYNVRTYLLCPTLPSTFDEFQFEGVIMTLQPIRLILRTYGHSRFSSSLFIENPNSLSSVRTLIGLTHFISSSVLLQSCDSTTLHTGTNEQNRLGNPLYG